MAPEFEEEESKESPSGDDLKVLAITWNMGNAEAFILLNQLPQLLPNAEDYDMIFMTTQECM